ncbi:alpha/beta fold hydrolase [Streptomyces sp. NPDC047725]|uniref:alpha/beta fold hydrolase n=1 Tax=Streptomyces sp. NPDC047725 TaxID=3365487 RepID=UPI0037193CCF
MEQTIRKRVPVSGGSWVTVDVHGDPGAPGLVVLPGVMSDAHAWRHVASAISAWPSVMVVNRRGRTPSGPLTDAYSLRTEVEDLGTVLDVFPGTTAVFSWSYGGLIALLTADERPLRRLIAYEPVMRPFGRHALPDLKTARENGDWDATVDIVLRKITGLDPTRAEALRADREVWEALRRLSEPLYDETLAVNEPLPDLLARRAGHVDLIVGGANRGTAPYGTTFDDICLRVPAATVHELPGQGHLVHLEAPAQLARLIDELAA